MTRAERLIELREQIKPLVDKFLNGTITEDEKAALGRLRQVEFKTVNGYETK